jgi:hypothetical protein
VCQMKRKQPNGMLYSSDLSRVRGADSTYLHDRTKGYYGEQTSKQEPKIQPKPDGYAVHVERVRVVFACGGHGAAVWVGLEWLERRGGC